MYKIKNMWRYIDCFNIVPNRYYISSEGIIIDLFKSEVIRYKIYGGYYSCALMTINGLKSFMVHRLVIYTFNMAYYIDKPYVNHKDLDKFHNDLNNLEFVTLSENTRHAIQNHCRSLVDGYIEPLYPNSNRSGILNSNNKVFSESQIHYICSMMEKSIPYPSILESMGLPVEKNLLDILTKIRSKKLWYCISREYNIPNKEYRSKAINYSDNDIHKICSLISKGYSLKELAIEFGIDYNNRKEQDKFRHFVDRIKRKETYTYISNQYW